MDSTQQPTFRELLASKGTLSLCTGGRGLESGIESLIGESNIAAYVEIEAFATWNLLSFMEKGLLDPAPIYTDLKTFPSASFYQKIFCITGGYPCQPFSVAGKRQAEKDPRHLWPHIRRIISTVKPVCCFFENVANHLNLGFDEVSRDLRKMGYQVEAGIFSAEETGAPHLRKRLFILAIKLEYAQSGWTGESRNPNQKRKGLRATRSSGNGKLGNAFYTGFQRYGSKHRLREGEKQVQINGSSHVPNSQRYNGFQLRGKEAPKGFGSDGTELCARPGHPQHEWEEPRSIESGMGSTIDGYNFREDLLRMYGNFVVHQQASLALDTLLKKFEL